MKLLFSKNTQFRRISQFLFLFIVCLLFFDMLPAQTPREVKMDIVIIDQPWMFNRMGAQQPTGMVFPLKSDVVAINGREPGVGNAMLRTDKRPRPIVLRANQGDKLTITLTNWLTPYDPTGTVERYGQPISQKRNRHPENWLPKYWRPVCLNLGHQTLPNQGSRKNM